VPEHDESNERNVSADSRVRSHVIAEDHSGRASPGAAWLIVPHRPRRGLLPNDRVDHEPADGAPASGRNASPAA
jgi:hypothetical protein